MIRDEQLRPHDLVFIGMAIGASEALMALLETLPSDFPAPIILGQEVEALDQAWLGTQFQQCAALPIQVVEAPTALEPGRIYLVPPGLSVAIESGAIVINGPASDWLSLDALLASAAHACGERLIAVILAGPSSAGANGIIEVKKTGGTVILISAVLGAAGPPLAMPPSVVDFEASVDQVGPLIRDLLAGANPQPAEDTEQLLRVILDEISHQANVNFRPYKPSTIMRRIGRRMMVTRHHTMSEYVEFIQTHPAEIGELVNAFLINVTQFFRDPEAFSYLKLEILPELIAQARSRDRVLRFWSAGCSTGEEAYSLALLLADLLGAELLEWSIKIFATDLDEAAINFARLGVYPENVLANLPAEYRARYFERVDHSFRIAKPLRQMVIFGQQDLSRSAPFPRINMVLCRNVLIYFAPELQDYVLNQFAFSLRTHAGYLVLGKAEAIRPNVTSYEPAHKQWKIYRCTGDTLPLARRPRPGDQKLASSFHQQPVRPRARLGASAASQDESSVVEMNHLRRLNESLLRFLQIGVVVINRSYQLLTANAAARRALGLHDVTEQDFLHAVNGIPYPEVRASIDTVFREHKSIALPEIELALAAGGSGRFVALTIVPMQLGPSYADMVAISITDVTEQVQIRRSLESVQLEQSQLVEDLRVANQRLNDLNKELMDANEELQVSNEELVLTYEELQATSEEFEATNEELQATNEELETNNEELQATNEELQTTNEELRARTGELQEMAALLESERVRLAEIVELAPFYILVLRGPHLQVEAFNPRYAPILESSQVLGRPLERVIELFWQQGRPLVALALDAYEHDQIRHTPRLLTFLRDKDGLVEGYFTYTLVPSHNAAGRVDGVIVYAVDETGQRLRDLEEERAQLRLIFNHAPQAALALYDAHSTDLITASPLYRAMVEAACGQPPGGLAGGKWAATVPMVDPAQAVELWNAAIGQQTTIRVPEVPAAPDPEGQTLIWDWNVTPIMDADDPDLVAFILVSGVEVSSQVRIRQELERVDLLKDEFLSLASHELRTPLTPLMGYAGMLKRLATQQATEYDPDRNSRILEFISTFSQQLQRLNRLVEDLIDVGRLQSGKFTLARAELRLDDVLARAVEQGRMIAPETPIRLDVAPANYATIGDEDRLTQVVLNLFNNAITHGASPQGVAVRLRCLPAARQSLAMAEIEIQDYGVGIDTAADQGLFSRFYQIAPPGGSGAGGLGLGLYICKQIVEQHQGTISLNSAVGHGSTFTINLPLLDS